MNRRSFIKTSGTALTAMALPQWLTAAGKKAAASKPNIIFILADDLGIGNVSCYGADNFKTPNVDALAKSGIPVRALLRLAALRSDAGTPDDGTLRLPHRHDEQPDRLPPQTRKRSHDAHRPQNRGLCHGHVWKMGAASTAAGRLGFDEYLRFQGSGKYWNYQRDNKTYTVNGKETPLHDGEYLPDTMHKFVVDFITRHKDQPFYLYYPMSHVHAEILPTPDTAPGTTGKFKLVPG